MRSKKFLKYYILITLLSLIATLVFNIPVLATSVELQTLGAVLGLIAFPLLVGLVLLVFLNVNRNEKLGVKIIHFAYITLVGISICFTIIGYSLFFLDQVSVTYSFSISIMIGVSLAGFCYLTLSQEKVWTIV